jgi:hypothetical protein
MAGVITQGEIGRRVKILCQSLCGGDREKLAHKASCNPSVLRDLMKGSPISDDAFEHVLSRLCAIPGISAAWLRTGRGHMTIQAGGLGPAPLIPPGSSPASGSSPPPADGTGSAGMGADIFAELVARVRALEQTLSPEGVGRLTQDIKTQIKTVREAFETRVQELGKNVESHAIAQAETERKLSDLDRISAGLYDTVATLDRRIVELQDALTAPAPAPAQRRAREEELPEDARISTGDFLALDGEMPAKFYEAGMSARTLHKYLSEFEGQLGAPRSFDHRGAATFAVGSYRALARFLAWRRWDLKSASHELFLAFAQGGRS